MGSAHSGLGGRGGLPIYPVSLSGGGFRSALYNAGVLRVLHEDGKLVRRCRTHHVFVNAVSGGTIPALIWDAHIRDVSESEPLWPEKVLLDLVTSVPRLGGRYNWGFKIRGAWEVFLTHWWERHMHGIQSEDAALVTQAEVLDFLSGHIYTFCGTYLQRPDREFYKAGEAFAPISLANYDRTNIVPFAIARATVFPLYFSPWRLEIQHHITNVAGSYEFLDAGVIDNLGAHPFFAFFAKQPPVAIPGEGNVWFVANAGAAFSVPAGAARRAMGAPRKHKLSMLDRIFRYTGDLAQPASEKMTMDLVDAYTPFDVKGVRIGYLPDPERPWHLTASLPDQIAVSLIPTALSRMNRDDAVCVMLQGAQAASFAVRWDESRRQRIKAELLSLGAL
jgi:hypothetical protein